MHISSNLNFGSVEFYSNDGHQIKAFFFCRISCLTVVFFSYSIEEKKNDFRLVCASRSVEMVDLAEVRTLS